ncbi:Ribose 1,5-bisphosphate isomerase [Candidatus Gugararchaeum adminiculabundum]|nr:Ribose 1,5-bisphosphate isomerase [Candidatus Gugararchaeum adminiculabundum]
MVNEDVEQICRDIKALKIQGARNIAKWAVKALALQAKESDAKTPASFYGELVETADALASTRPTEPMLRNSLRNAIRFVFAKMTKEKVREISALKKIVAEAAAQYEKDVASDLEAIAEYGAREIPKGAVVLTHCHSSTVTAAIKRAYENDSKIRAICTETRPKFQGRITAKELRDAGLDVTMIVDSAVKSVIHEVDAVLVGADAVTAKGDLINKIGTAGVALIAYEQDIPFYSCAELHKFDLMTIWGKIEEIEERSADEVADPKEFRGIKIRNPAFDLTLAKYVSAYITEIGVMPPQGLIAIAKEKFKPYNPMSRNR